MKPLAVLVAVAAAASAAAAAHALQGKNLACYAHFGDPLLPLLASEKSDAREAWGNAGTAPG